MTVTTGRFSGDPDWPVLGDPRGGSADFALASLRHFVQNYARHAISEGLDSPENIGQGLWGLSLSSRRGADICSSLVGLVNFGFFRRTLLALQIESMAQRVW